MNQFNIADPNNLPRPLTEQELADLRADMKASSAWARESIEKREMEKKES